MLFTDTHIHLYSGSYDGDRDELIREAGEQGIKRFFLPAIDSEHLPGMHDLERRYPGQIFLMAGLHPTHVKENFGEELAVVEKQLAEGKYYGVGETGIDLYWDKSTLGWQQEAFRRQIRLAKDHDLPVVIHCRGAFEEVFQVLEGEQDDRMKGIFHCFTGNLDQARQALSYNLKLGIGGVVTFKNGGIDKFLREIPIEAIVLETDGPYLAPKPYRGKRNKPVYLKEIAEKIAEIYQLDLEAVAHITTRTSEEIFRI